MAKTEIIAEPGVPQILITREFNAPRELLYRAHTDPELLAQWLGPRRLTMIMDHFDVRDGGTWRFVHRDADGNEFGFHGVFHGTPSPENGIVQTFEFEGAPGHVSLETLTFEERGDRTLVRTNDVFQSVEDRDAAIASGMEEGINESMERLDELLSAASSTSLGQHAPKDKESGETMGKVIVDITMSLDGFVTGPNDGPGNGLGDGGRVLHEWVFEGRTDADAQLLFEEPMKTLGSCVLGRRTFDIAEEAWGDNPPFGSAQVFVLTHRPHETLNRGATTFIFVTDGMEGALKQAQTAAGDKNVSLMGANISQQYLKAGLVDEMQIHVANVLLGAGRPLFANIGDKQIKLERTRVIATPAVTHLRYRVVK